MTASQRWFIAELYCRNHWNCAKDNSSSKNGCCLSCSPPYSVLSSDVKIIKYIPATTPGPETPGTRDSGRSQQPSERELTSGWVSLRQFCPSRTSPRRTEGSTPAGERPPVSLKMEEFNFVETKFQNRFYFT